MWLERFLQLIEASPIGAAVERRKEILRNTDPQRIYVENVRHFFGITTTMAKALCDLAVRQGIFDRCVAVLCPNDECERIVEEACGDAALPETIHCDVCEGFNREHTEFPLDACKRLTFYRVRHEAAETSEKLVEPRQHQQGMVKT